jgi:K(+)-stimulated pyrophosphate-energized sodium pump
MVELGLILAISVLGLAFAGYPITWVMARDTGTPAMREVSDAIKAGAEAFLRRQNKTIAIANWPPASPDFHRLRVRGQHEAFDPTETESRARLLGDPLLVLGAMRSVAAGYVGMWI